MIYIFFAANKQEKNNSPCQKFLATALNGAKPIFELCNGADFFYYLRTPDMEKLRLEAKSSGEKLSRAKIQTANARRLGGSN